MRQTFKADRRGFTLIEVMIVTSIIGIMAAAMTVSMAGARQRARIVKAEVETRELINAIRAYEIAMDELPFDQEENKDLEATEANLRDLILPSERNGRVVYLNVRLVNGAMRDPWGRPYRIRVLKGDAGAGQSRREAFVSGAFVPSLSRPAE